jgi:AcrR family transcriptional regulator
MAAKTKAPSPVRGQAEQVAPDGVARNGNPRPGGPRHGGQASGAAHEQLGRERVMEIQRARILGAMVEECAVRGAANVTVAHVVDRAGVSRRTFYELYSDREACFLGAFDDGVARASRYVLDSYDPQAGWADRCRTAFTGLLTFLTYERGVGQLLVVGSLGAGASALERRKRVLAQMIALVDRGGSESKGGDQLPPLTAEGIVGGVLSVLHSRLLDEDAGPLLALTGPLMGMIVLPYLGPVAARRELAKPVPKTPAHRAESSPLGRLEMRLTYRTVRVLMAIAELGGRGSYPSNRAVATAAEVTDQGQMSKLLARLQGLDLIANSGGGASRGEPNAWTLTEKGWGVQGAIAEETSGG